SEFKVFVKPTIFTSISTTITKASTRPTDMFGLVKMKNPVAAIANISGFMNSSGATVEKNNVALLKDNLHSDVEDAAFMSKWENDARNKMGGVDGIGGMRLHFIDKNYGNAYIIPKSGKAEILLPYPKGSDSTDEFVIYHFKEVVSSDVIIDASRKILKIEGPAENHDFYKSMSKDTYNPNSPEIIKSSNKGIDRMAAGLRVSVDSLSPFIIAYKSDGLVPSDDPNNPNVPKGNEDEDTGKDKGKKENSEKDDSNWNTGDSSSLMTYYLMALISAGCIVVILRKTNKR
ncbi:MAG: hypothetical protein ACRCUS_08595, partial [Anaerovoracaceae bacterium]